MAEQMQNLSEDILWGVAAIATYVRRSPRQVYYMIAKGQLPATKLGARTIAARKSDLDFALGKLAMRGGAMVLQRETEPGTPATE